MRFGAQTHKMDCDNGISERHTIIMTAATMATAASAATTTINGNAVSNYKRLSHTHIRALTFRRSVSILSASPMPSVESEREATIKTPKSK